MTYQYQKAVLETLVERLEHVNEHYSSIRMVGESFEDGLERTINTKGGQRIIDYIKQEIEQIDRYNAIKEEEKGL